LWAICAWWFLFTPAPAVVEYCFSQKWYRWVLALMTPATQTVSFPIVFVLLFAGLAALLLSWIRNGAFLWGIRRLFMVLPVIVVWFIAFWGAGYRRVPVEERLHLDASAISANEIAGVRALLLDEVKRDLPLPGEREVSRAIGSIAASMERIVASWDGRPIVLPCRVKWMPKGFLLSNGTSGMCAPFTLEALVDKGLPDTALVYSAAHELGHIAGFCPEDEASFIGWVAGLQAEDKFARYASALSAYSDLMDQLRSDEFKKAFAALPESAKEDLRKADEAYRKYRIAWFSRISWRAYNRYLQSQGVHEGVQNYSHGITLLVYASRKGMAKM